MTASSFPPSISVCTLCSNLFSPLRWPALALATTLACSLPAYSQTSVPPPIPLSSPETVPVKLGPEELTQLLAPIALYPDALIALILPASTVPSDVVMGTRFLEKNGDISLVDSQPWDDSVKSLTRYPEVLTWMDQNLEWTAAVGEAFVNQPADVMNTIQGLREQARAAGNLVDTPQQKIVVEQEVIRIVPADPEVIYVPVYDPQVVYVQTYTPGYSPFISFGVGFAVGSWLNCDFDWHRRQVYRGNWRGWDNNRYNNRNWNNNNINVVNIDITNVNVWQPSANSRRQLNQRQRNNNGNARYVDRSSQNNVTINSNPQQGDRNAGQVNVDGSRNRYGAYDPNRQTRVPRATRLEPSNNQDGRNRRPDGNRPANVSGTAGNLQVNPNVPRGTQEGGSTVPPPPGVTGEQRPGTTDSPSTRPVPGSTPPVTGNTPRPNRDNPPGQATGTPAGSNPDRPRQNPNRPVPQVPSTAPQVPGQITPPRTQENRNRGQGEGRRPDNAQPAATAPATVQGQPQQQSQATPGQAPASERPRRGQSGDQSAPRPQTQAPQTQQGQRPQRPSAPQATPQTQQPAQSQQPRPQSQDNSQQQQQQRQQIQERAQQQRQERSQQESQQRQQQQQKAQQENQQQQQQQQRSQQQEQQRQQVRERVQQQQQKVQQQHSNPPPQAQQAPQTQAQPPKSGGGRQQSGGDQKKQKSD